MFFNRSTYVENDVLPKVKEYIDSCKDTFEVKSIGQKVYEEKTVRLPTAYGLAKHLDISVKTLGRWRAKYENFGEAVEDMLGLQGDKLINNGLSGKYNPVITKLMLSTNHGMTERVNNDLTSGGKELSGIIETAYARLGNTEEVPSDTGEGEK